MRDNLFIKSVIVMLFTMLIAFAFSGCKDKNDVYNAASEYIKVEHPDEPYSEEENSEVTENKKSGSETVSDVSDSTDTTESKNEDGSDVSSSTDSSKEENSSKSSPKEYPKLEGDQGTVIIS